jgi:hypothetical protein
MHKFDDPQEFPWSSSEFEATELETDMEDCKTQLSDILFSPAAGSSTSALSSGSSYPATTLSQSSTGTQALLSRFPELTELDLQKVVDISSKVSYICCKCHDSHQPPPARHKTTSMYGKERRPKRFRISKPTYRSARLRSHVDVSNSGQKLSFQQDSEKDTDGIVELTMTSSHNIPDFRQRVPSIITYAPRGLYSLKADPQPPFVGIGPPGSRTGDIIVQFMECDVAAVLRPVGTSTESTRGDDSGGTCTKVFKYYEAVGRALLLGNKNENDYVASFKPLAKSRFRFPRHTALNNVQDQFSCYFDMETLWTLTR